MDTASSSPPEKVVASTVIRNIGQLVTIAQQPVAGATGSLQVVSPAAIAVHNGTITWVGVDQEAEPLFVPGMEAAENSITIIDAQGAVVTPGFVDSHTHLVFAGDRAQEFHLRRAGISYAELLARGHGILTTVQATRTASAETLTQLALVRLNSLSQHGTTTVEIKTGYGLDIGTEEACLRIINGLNAYSTLQNA